MDRMGQKGSIVGHGTRHRMVEMISRKAEGSEKRKLSEQRQIIYRDLKTAKACGLAGGRCMKSTDTSIQFEPWEKEKGDRGW